MLAAGRNQDVTLDLPVSKPSYIFAEPRRLTARHPNRSSSSSSHPLQTASASPSGPRGRSDSAVRAIYSTHSLQAVCVPGVTPWYFLHNSRPGELFLVLGTHLRAATRFMQDRSERAPAGWGKKRGEQKKKKMGASQDGISNIVCRAIDQPQPYYLACLHCCAYTSSTGSVSSRALSCAPGNNSRGARPNQQAGVEEEIAIPSRRRTRGADHGGLSAFARHRRG